MSCRNHCWRVILIFCSCAPILHQDNELARGLQLYQNKQYAAAADHFESYHIQHPDHDSTLYYLFDCYKHMNKPEDQIEILEKLIHLKTSDVNVYLNLLHFYRKYDRYKDLYNLISRYPEELSDHLDKRLALTRRLFAELVCGACRSNVNTDPLIFTISKGYLPLFPDGELYPEDTLSNAHLVILIDRLIEPKYPRNFFPMKNVSTKSYLYLPYMRLVDSGILPFDAYLVPELPAHITTAVQAIEALVERGHFD
jgi:tetratricopeptide (TPR) repeat protein